MLDVSEVDLLVTTPRNKQDKHVLMDKRPGPRKHVSRDFPVGKKSHCCYGTLEQSNIATMQERHDAIGRQRISLVLYSSIVPSVSSFFVVNSCYLRNDTFASSYLASAFPISRIPRTRPQGDP